MQRIDYQLMSINSKLTPHYKSGPTATVNTYRYRIIFTYKSYRNRIVYICNSIIKISAPPQRCVKEIFKYFFTFNLLKKDDICIKIIFHSFAEFIYPFLILCTAPSLIA